MWGRNASTLIKHLRELFSNLRMNYGLTELIAQLLIHSFRMNDHRQAAICESILDCNFGDFDNTINIIGVKNEYARILSEISKIKGENKIWLFTSFVLKTVQHNLVI